MRHKIEFTATWHSNEEWANPWQQTLIDFWKVLVCLSAALKLWCPNSKPRYFSWRGRKKDPDINGETSCEKLYTLISSHVSLDGKQLPEFTDTSDSLFDLPTPEKTIQVSFLVRYLTSFTGRFCVISSILQSSLRSSLWEQQDLILMWPVVSFI